MAALLPWLPSLPRLARLPRHGGETLRHALTSWHHHDHLLALHLCHVARHGHLLALTLLHHPLLVEDHGLLPLHWHLPRAASRARHRCRSRGCWIHRLEHLTRLATRSSTHDEALLPHHLRRVGLSSRLTAWATHLALLWHHLLCRRWLSRSLGAWRAHLPHSRLLLLPLSRRGAVTQLPDWHHWIRLS